MAEQKIATDVVAAILGDDAYRRIKTLRDANPQQIEDLQTYYEVLFDPEPASVAELDLKSRALIALRTAAHTRSQKTVTWYAALAQSHGASDESIAAATDIQHLPQADASLAAAFRRVDLVTQKPAAAEKADIDWLKTAGFSPAAILSLSQIIAFVSYQVRFLAILRAIGGKAA